MTVKTEIEQQLEALIAIGERLSASYHRDGRELVISYASSESETSLRAFYTGAVAAIGRIAGEDSDYYRAGAGIADQGVVVETRSSSISHSRSDRRSYRLA